jgi:non-reducing end alpha-L-arabinofuranosidase
MGTSPKMGGGAIVIETNQNLPSSNMEFALGILKTSTDGATPQYAIRVGDATAGALTTAYDGPAPARWQMGGGIVLGIGGDNSNSSLGTFFEGAITIGRPADATEDLVLQNVQAAGYGK